MMSKKKSKQQFVRIPNYFFYVNNALGGSYIKNNKVNHKEFSLLFYLISKNEGETSIGFIKDNFEYQRGFRTTAQIKQMIIKLNQLKLINVSKDIKKLNIKSSFKCYLDNIDYTNGHQQISIRLFDDYIQQLGTDGFTLFCALYFFHSDKLGGIGSLGHVDYRRDFLIMSTGLTSSSIVKSTKAMEGCRKIVKIIEPEYIVDAENNIKSTARKYIILPKVDVNNKYYI